LAPETKGKEMEAEDKEMEADLSILRVAEVP
jgi:hypothetical protein